MTRSRRAVPAVVGGARPASEDGGPDDGSRLRSVEIALGVLDVLADESQISLSELARRVDIAKSTAHRTCTVLMRAGLIARSESKEYFLGSRMVAYGQLALEQSELSVHAPAVLSELHRQTGATVQIGVAVDGDAVFPYRIVGAQFHYPLPSRTPVHRSSAGKVLAAWSPEVLEARLRRGLDAATGYTIVVPRVLADELAGVRARGYARSIDEANLGSSSLAVPVRVSPTAPTLAAISMVGSTSKIVGEHESRNVTKLVNAARELVAAIERTR
jgi:DNA-binding IclR family transcriptional regulator